jgi:hypothetical protein
MSLSKAISKTTESPDSSRIRQDPAGGGGVSMPQLDRLSGMADGGADAARMRNLSGMADASPQVGNLQGMADRAMPTPAPSPAAAFNFDQEIRQMEGQLTFGAKFNKFLGKESTYSKLIAVVKEYAQALKPEAKEALKPKVLAVCRDWVDKHGTSKDPGDLQKKASIERIRGALETPVKPPEKPPAPPAPKPAPAPDPGAPKPVTPKVEEVTPEVEPEPVVEPGLDSLTPFETIRTAFEEYQAMAAGTLEGAGALFAAFQKLYTVRTGITAWMRDFGKSKGKDEVERRGRLMLIEIAMGALEADVSVAPYFQAHVTGLDVNALAKGIYRVRRVEVTMESSYGTATGDISNVNVQPNQFAFEKLALRLSGSIEVMQGFTIGAPHLDISASGGGYTVKAGGDLVLEKPGSGGVGSFSASGTVEAGYDFATKQMTDPVIAGGKLTATLFGAMDISVDALDYADGKLTAAAGSLTIRAMDKTATVDVKDVSYSAAAGISFNELTYTSPDTYEPVKGFTVAQPVLKLTKTSDGWDLGGSGRLGVTFGNRNFRVDKIEADVALTYSLGKGMLSAFTAQKAHLEMTIFESLKLVVDDLNYADKVLSAAEGKLSINLLGGNLEGKVVEPTYDPVNGLGMKGAGFTAPGSFEPVPGFAVTQPGLELIRGEAGWQVRGEGQLEFRTGLGDIVKLKRVAGKVSALYNVRDRSLAEASVEQGEVDMTLFDVVNIVGSGISFDKAAGILTIGSASVAVGVPSEAFGEASLGGAASNLRIGKGSLDWDSIQINPGKPVTMGDFVFQPPTGILTKSGKGFIVTLKDASGSFQIGELVTVDGKVSLEWAPHLNKGMPRITEGELKAATEEIDVFQTFVPFFADGAAFSTGFTIPFAAGPVPMEASFEIGGSATATVKFDMGMAYGADAFTADGNIAVRPEMGMYIKIGVGVGNRFVAYIGGYLKGSIDASVQGDLGFHGVAVQEAAGKYAMEEMSVNYGIGADLTAALKGGAEVKALYFFSKELYEVDIKTWDLGRAEMKGSYDFVGGENLEDSRSNVFQGLGQTGASGAALGIPAPPNRVQHKAYRQALERLMQTIDQLKLSAEDNQDEAAAAIIARHKTKLNASFQRLVDRFTPKRDLLTEKNERNSQLVEDYRRTHAEWLQRQDEKLKEATEKGSLGLGMGGSGAGITNFFHWKTPEWYDKKIIQGKAKYDKGLQTKLARLEKIQSELEIVTRELDTASGIMAEMDRLLKPDGNIVLEGIIASVEQKKTAIDEAVREGEAAVEVDPEVFDFTDDEVSVGKEKQPNPEPQAEETAAPEDTAEAQPETSAGGEKKKGRLSSFFGLGKKGT